MSTVTSTFRVGHFRCTLSVPTDQRRGSGIVIDADWQPHPPGPGSLTAADLAQYVAGRHRLLEEVAKETGLRIAVVDL